MNVISKEAILSKTHYGLNIYAYILRYYYPEQTVLSISGRACLPARNPFNDGKQTLLIVVKNNIAMHKDCEDAIPAGDAFSFAELHLKQSGDMLLQTLNNEMNLHIDKKPDFYANNRKEVICPDHSASSVVEGKEARFSFFKAPIKNTKPYKSVSLNDIYNYIVGGYCQQRTEQLRAFSNTKLARQYKAQNFDYCTFSGVFTSRKDEALEKHSGLLCIDFDHIGGRVEAFKQTLLTDDYFDTQLLFVSPSGDGLKWIIPMDMNKATHGEYFDSVANYIRQTYGLEVDKSGRDISRACFLPHDPNAFINPLIQKKDEQKNI
jgi:hypothetical protein